MSRRPWTALAAAALVAAAGCGSDGPASSSIGTSSAPGTVAAATVPPPGAAPAPSATGGAAASSETAVTAAAVPTAAGPTTSEPGATAGSSTATDPAWAAAFGRATITVGGQRLRVLAASTEAQRHQGLRAVTTLAPYDGMLFVFDQDGRVAFTMADTLVPLSIGFYDSSGQPVGQLEMTPCTGTDSTCPTYDVGKPFRYALETQSGHLPSGALQI